MNTIKELEIKAVEIRKIMLQMIHDAGAGHTGGSLSSVDILVSLFYNKMKHDANNPNWDERDRFLLSKGHSVEGYYSVLADSGYFPKEDLSTFSKFKSELIGHPNKNVPGVEMNTGSLGHGLPIGVGMALGAKKLGNPCTIYVLMGDGELAEGSIWEAAMAASNYKLDNLIAIIDRNGLQISGCTEDVMSLENLKEKWAAFGWDTVEVDGNNMQSLIEGLDIAKKRKGKPQMIIAKTIKGKGVSFMENVPTWHHGVPSKEELEQALKELDNSLKELM